MRHFGCAFCREQLIQMTRASHDIRAAGADTEVHRQADPRA
jgi:hypothetical protein